METLLENSFIKVVHDGTNKLTQAAWKPATEKMETEEWREIIRALAKCLELNKSEYYLTDDKELNFVFEVAHQAWMAETLGNVFVATGIKKCAIIRPTELIAQLSVEQTVDEAPNLPFATEFFDSIEDAKKWLFG